MISWLFITPIIELAFLGLVSAILTKNLWKDWALLRLIGIGIALIVGTILATSYWRLFWIPQFLIAPVFPPLAVLGLVTLLLKKRDHFAVFCFLCATLVLLVSLTTIVVDKWQTQQTRQYCASLISEIEAHKITHGGYPEQIANMDLPARPKPLAIQFNGEDEGCSYSSRSSDGQYFMFVNTAIWSGWSYDSIDDQWEYVD